MLISDLFNSLFLDVVGNECVHVRGSPHDYLDVTLGGYLREKFGSIPESVYVYEKRYLNIN